MSSGVQLLKTDKDTLFEEVGSATDLRRPNDGVIYMLKGISLGYQYLPAVFTPDGEFRKLGFERLTVDEFAELLENNEELKEKYTKEAESHFKFSDLDKMDRFYVCGCSTMLVYCKSEYAPAEYYDYMFVNYIQDEYPPVIVDTAYDPELLYGVNLERLNVTCI
ncbi:MAG: hypothetical protein IK093_14240 [Ruminiclostridium sp.]|nr:hypothetical protein [Ruminiclostridium sp.]